MRKPFNKGAQNELFGFAKTNRKIPTETENILWEVLRNKKLGGYKFRRQHPIDDYILDFYCHSKKLCIELDGAYHNEPKQHAYDLRRTQELNQFEIKVLRFSNEEIINNLQEVLDVILLELERD